AVLPDDHHFGAVVLQIGKLGPRAQIDLSPQHAVAHVVEMGSLRTVEEDASFYFRRVANDAAGTDEASPPHVGAVANDGARPDPRGAHDHGSRLDDGPFADEYRTSQKGSFLNGSFNADA